MTQRNQSDHRFLNHYDILSAWVAGGGLSAACLALVYIIG